MTPRTYPETRMDIKSGVTIGPRVRRDVEHRIRELEARFRPTVRDLCELQGLKELLRTGGGQC
jgi:hypothetical protein